MELREYVQALKDRWNLLAEGAVIVLAVIGTFVAPPPEPAADGESLLGLGRFVTAVLLGLWLIPVVTLARRQHMWLWWGGAILILLLALASLFYYRDRMDRWTARYPEYSTSRVVIGDEMQPRAAQHRENLTAQRGGIPPTNEEMIMDAVGNVATVWHADDIRRNGRRLALLYLATMGLFASLMIMVVQAIYCASRPTALAPPAPAEPAPAEPVPPTPTKEQP